MSAAQTDDNISSIAPGSSTAAPPPGAAGAPSALDSLRTFSPRAEAARLSAGRMPCARKSLLFGIGTGLGVTAVGAIAGRGLRPAANWGVGAFVLISLTSWESCRRSLAAEAERVRIMIDNHSSRRRPRSAQDEGPATAAGPGQ